jgi:hypothetical protein
MRKLTLTERILCIITYLQESTLKTITEPKLKELLGNPPKSSYYRIMRMLLTGSVEYRPLLVKVKSDEENAKFKSFYDQRNNQ